MLLVSRAGQFGGKEGLYNRKEIPLLTALVIPAIYIVLRDDGQPLESATSPLPPEGGCTTAAQAGT